MLVRCRFVEFANRMINISMIRKLYGKSDDPQMKELLDYISKNKGKLIDNVLVQQNLVFEYMDYDVEVLYDEKLEMSYVMHRNKKMYFPRSMNAENIRIYYRSNLLEQDIRSAHCYFTDMSIYPIGGVYVDLGAAEGNFSLDLLDRASHIYLFEGDEKWVEALEATFSPYKEKVTIIPKYVTDKESENTTSLKGYFKSIERIDVIKMDIEGAEVEVINNNIDFFDSHTETNLIVCTYHLENDEADIKRILNNYSFKEQGWIMGTNRNVLHPYVRRVLMYGHKNV